MVRATARQLGRRGVRCHLAGPSPRCAG
jgi:hypothetical protein